MRLWILAALCLAACQQQPKPAAKPVETSFDGAQTTDAAALRAHGERISWTLGCRGCHRDKLEGGTFYERYASNLSRDLGKYTDGEIERVLRTGVPRDGRDLWGMPSELFQHLSAADMKALIADLRSVEPTGKPTQPPKPWELDAKEMIAKGELKTAAAFVEDNRKVAPVDLGPRYALGRYITRVTCAECHGPDLNGEPGGRPGGPPNLVVAGGYSREDLENGVMTWRRLGGRKLKNPLMGDVARERFTHFTRHERDALYAYLKARAEQPQ